MAAYYLGLTDFLEDLSIRKIKQKNRYTKRSGLLVGSIDKTDARLKRGHNSQNKKPAVCELLTAGVGSVDEKDTRYRRERKTVM